jgi:hypothetical protein
VEVEGQDLTGENFPTMSLSWTGGTNPIEGAAVTEGRVSTEGKGQTDVVERIFPMDLPLLWSAPIFYKKPFVPLGFSGVVLALEEPFLFATER